MDDFKPTAAQIEAASGEVAWLAEHLDITNADHVALWLENAIGGPVVGFLACQIVCAYENALLEMRAAGNVLAEELAGYAGHDDGCQIMTHGVWSDPIPCTCGYSAALTAYKEMTE